LDRSSQYFEAFRDEFLATRSFQGIAQKTSKTRAHYENMTQLVLTEKEMQRQIENLNMKDLNVFNIPRSDDRTGRSNDS
jgi:hypothetical protein